MELWHRRCCARHKVMAVQNLRPALVTRCGGWFRICTGGTRRNPLEDVTGPALCHGEANVNLRAMAASDGGALRHTVRMAREQADGGGGGGLGLTTQIPTAHFQTFRGSGPQSSYRSVVRDFQCHCEGRSFHTSEGGRGVGVGLSSRFLDPPPQMGLSCQGPKTGLGGPEGVSGRGRFWVPLHTVGGEGGIPCQGKSESINSGATKPVPFLKMSVQILQGWQKMFMRNSGRLLIFPGGLSWCINHWMPQEHYK